MALHQVIIGNHNVDIEDDVVGFLVSKTQYQNMESEIVQLRVEKKRLQDKVRQLQRQILGYELEAGLQQDIEPPGDFEDYPFSEN